MYTARSDCHSPNVISKIDHKKLLHYLNCVAATTGRPELVFFLVFKTSAGTSDVVGYCDCRHVCDDGESHHEELVQSDHVHCSASGTEDCLVMSVQFMCFQGVLRSLRCRCLLLGRVVRPSIGFLSKPVRHKKRRKSVLHLLICQFLPCRMACILGSCMRIWYVLEEALHDRSVILFLCGTLVISRVLEFL